MTKSSRPFIGRHFRGYRCGTALSYYKLWKCDPKIVRSSPRLQIVWALCYTWLPSSSWAGAGLCLRFRWFKRCQKNGCQLFQNEIDFYLLSQTNMSLSCSFSHIFSLFSEYNHQEFPNLRCMLSGYFLSWRGTNYLNFVWAFRGRNIDLKVTFITRCFYFDVFWRFRKLLEQFFYSVACLIRFLFHTSREFDGLFWMRGNWIRVRRFRLEGWCYILHQFLPYDFCIF